MQLSKRLQAVADLVTRGNRVADVGCDHAYTSIYLAKQMISPHIIAMDINQGPINRAMDNIKKYRCEDRIETRKSNGIEKLGMDEADTIIIAGMGGALTVQILKDRIEILKSVKELVLQPQSEIHKVREMLAEYDFIITEENMIAEDGKYYAMMKAVPVSLGKNPDRYFLTKKEHFYYGRLLLEQRNPVLARFLTWDMGICEEILKTIADGKTDEALKRLEEIRERVKLVQCGLDYYNR